jgi:AbrB family looped-hinge helix DNA binding protein
MLMETTKLSSKGQVIIPKLYRDFHHWEPGQELLVSDIGDGLLLRPKAAFAKSKIADVAGLFKGKVKALSAAQIKLALDQDLRSKWRDRG